MKKQVLVQYTVKPDRVAENEAAIRAVFEELHRKAPPGLQYAAVKLADGVSFAHIATVELVDGKNPLTEMPAFQAFAAGVKDRWEVPAVSADWTVVGTYGLLDDER
jgi:hypothetical protein